LTLISCIFSSSFWISVAVYQNISIKSSIEGIVEILPKIIDGIVKIIPAKSKKSRDGCRVLQNENGTPQNENEGCFNCRSSTAIKIVSKVE
jgi:hypothetical protein